MNPEMNKHPYILNIPSEITIDILSRLPIKTIIRCKCVCKRWHELLSTPEFAKSHLPRSTPGLAVYITQRDEYLCKLFEFDDSLELQNHDLHYNPILKFDPSSFSNSPVHNIAIECSVNGLLFLNSFGLLYICNPVTREYIPVPKLDDKVAGYPNIVTFGFGVSTSSGQYKVVRIFHEQVEKGSMPEVECMMYTLGTGNSWRRIDPSPRGELYEYDIRPSTGAFLNGFIHWLVGDSDGKQLISRLDLETELFEPFPPPPVPSEFPHKASLVVVKDCLWFCDCCSDDEIEIWVMKDYGDEKSWVRQLVIDKEIGDLGGMSYECLYPLNAFRDGDILFLWEHTCLFYYNDETKEAPEVGLFERDRYGDVEAIPHTSSFISLRNFARENVISF